MITADQLKDIKERTAALKQYLAIDEKIIQVEEEQLRTQAPGFWDDAKAAEAQMKKVKSLQGWIDGYKAVNNLTEEVEFAMEMFREEAVTEEEVDDAYARALTAIEELELKNMLRQEADSMSCVLKINSGAGGTESQDWAEMLMRMYMRWAGRRGGNKDSDNTDRRPILLRLPQRREWRAPPCTRVALQCTRQTYDLFCIGVCDTPGGRHHRDCHKPRTLVVGPLPKRRCRRTECEQGRVGRASALPI